MSLTLLCLTLSGVGALQVNIPEDIYEFARGDNITLPCTFVPKGKSPLVIITWTLEGLQANSKENLVLTHYFPTGQTDITPLFEGRVSLDVDVAKGKANLKISSISLADNKVFECRVQIPGDDEGKLVDTTRLVVLVAPSVPICKIQGKAEYGQNINLTCVSEEGSPPPAYSWTSHDVRNVRRPFAPRTTTNGGILSLFNLTKDTSGYYVCISKNKIRSASCNLTLSVMPPSMNIGSTAGIIGGVVFLLILLVIIIICCCRYKKKKEQEQYAMGVREEMYSDKEPTRNGEGHKPDGQEDAGEYDDVPPTDRRDRYEDRSERDYDDRRSDYNDRRSDYDDRGRDYDDRRSDYDDRRDRYSDRNDRYDDDRRYDDRRDRRYDDDRYADERDRPPVPASKPPRDDYDD